MKPFSNEMLLNVIRTALCVYFQLYNHGASSPASYYPNYALKDYWPEGKHTLTKVGTLTFKQILLDNLQPQTLHKSPLYTVMVHIYPTFQC